MIGATTENPYFQVNQALLSRCMVIELDPLDDERAARGLRARCGILGAEVPEEATSEIVTRGG